MALPVIERGCYKKHMMSISPLFIIIIILAGFGLIAYMIARNSHARQDNENSLADVLKGMQETSDRLGSSQTVLADRLQQGQVQLNQRLDSLQGRLGDSLAKQTEKTGESLKTLHERLAVIDAAQKNITDLSQQMVGLQDILSNKQARGAFGEIQLNDLVINTLPPNAYEFQPTLSNGKRPDCMLLLPLPPGSIAIDAKFPLDSYEALRNAEDDVSKLQATRSFASDIKKHIVAISEKYILPGETAESALMFLPSEAVYAELHANFRNVVEESYKRRVWIVSPTTLMATLNTVRAVLKDARMKEQAGLIQDQVLKMMGDVVRLDDRVGKLRTHFSQAEKDIADIETSSKKISSHGDKIESMQLGNDGSPSEELEPPPPTPPTAPTTPDA